MVWNTPAAAEDVTAGSVLKKMEPKERFAYVNGIVEGLAYARFRKDTIAAGAKNEEGMRCVYRWFFTGDGSTYDLIETAFRKNPDYTPSVVIAALVKKECGE